MASVKELKQEVKQWKRRAESAQGEVHALRRRLEEIGGPLFLPSEDAAWEGKSSDKNKKTGKVEKTGKVKKAGKEKKAGKGRKSAKANKAKGGKSAAQSGKAASAATGARPLDLHEITSGSSVTDQREAWRRHSYLRDRYEFHLEAGEEKPTARLRANDDLVKKYGDSHGFSPDQLDGILT